MSSTTVWRALFGSASGRPNSKDLMHQIAEQQCSSDLAYAILFKKWLQELELDMPHPALALFCVLEKENDG